MRKIHPLSIETAAWPFLFTARLRVTALAAISALALGACKAKPQAVAVVPTVETPSMTAPDEASKAIPPDLYKSMPIFPGARVDHVRKPKGAMREIMFSAPGDFAQMVAYYKDQLKKNEFRITSSLIMPARKTWSCDFHFNGRPGSVMLFPSDEDKSRITIDLIYELPAKLDEVLMEPVEDFDVVGPGEIARQAPNPSEKEKRN